MPIATGNLTAVDAHENSRITAGLLNNPSIYNRAAGGLTVSQLITDFGRTHNLVRSSLIPARRRSLNAGAPRATTCSDRMDQAWLSRRSPLAGQCSKWHRKCPPSAKPLRIQVEFTFTKAKIRSDLDRSFADVQVSQSRLLLLDAQNSAQASMATLNDVLGSDQDQQYDLIDETNGNPPAAPTDPEALVNAAFSARPDLAAMNDNFAAAREFSTAECDLWLPTLSAMAAVGGTPARAKPDPDLLWYGAAGGQFEHSRLQRVSL